jgi:hypothetical protein
MVQLTFSRANNGGQGKRYVCRTLIRTVEVYSVRNIRERT